MRPKMSRLTSAECTKVDTRTTYVTHFTVPNDIDVHTVSQSLFIQGQYVPVHFKIVRKVDFYGKKLGVVPTINPAFAIKATDVKTVSTFYLTKLGAEITSFPFKKNAAVDAAAEDPDHDVDEDIDVEFSVVWEITSEVVKAESTFEKMLRNADLNGDMCMTTTDGHIRVHKAVLENVNDVLKMIVTSDCEVDSIHTDMDIECAEVIREYIYTGRIRDVMHFSADKAASLLKHADMYGLSDICFTVLDMVSVNDVFDNMRFFKGQTVTCSPTMKAARDKLKRRISDQVINKLQSMDYVDLVEVADAILPIVKRARRESPSMTV
jgi:hypothetical protein